MMMHELIMLISVAARASQVRHMLAESGRLKAVRQVIVNPSDEALWNLMSACSNTGASLSPQPQPDLRISCGT